MAASGGVEEKRPAGRPKETAAKEKKGTKVGLGSLDAKKVRLGLAALLAVAIVVIGAIALLGGDSGDDSSGGSEEANGAVALTASELLARASSLGAPAYWLGPRVGTESYELSTTPDGRVYVRYLTGGAEAGDPRPDFLTVGTYPVEEAGQALQGAASGEGGQTVSRQDGYEILGSEEATNAYVVFDDQPDVQIEIFSPQPGEASELAKSGALEPIG